MWERASRPTAMLAIGAGLLITGSFAAPALGGDVTARWVEPVSGHWTDPARWSSNPFYPDNGNPAEAVYRVLLDVPGPGYTVTLDAPVHVGSTLISSPAATLEQAGGTFTVGSLAVGQGGVGRYRMTGGTLSVSEIGVGRARSDADSFGLFEQLSGRVDVMGASYVGSRSGLTTGSSTGTLLISGGSSRYSVTSPTSSSQTHFIGVGSASTGVAQFSNFASVTLGGVDLGGGGGTGTMIIENGARVSVNALNVGRSSNGDGTGTVILGGGSSRLTLGSGNLRIGSTTGSANLFVNGGTLTLPPQLVPIPAFLVVGSTGSLTVNAGAVESQRTAMISGQFIVNGGTVSVSKFVTGAAGGSLAGGGLIINGGRVTTPEVQLYSSTYLQTGGAAFIGSLALGANEYSTAFPDARLAGGTLEVGNLNISTGTFTYQQGLFNVSLISIPGGRFVATPGRDKTLRVGSLSISGQGRMDLGDNVMLLDSGAAPPLGSIRALLRTGYNNGAWDGPGIISSVAQSTPTHGIGYARPSPLFTPLLVAYTRWGDANVDGAVDLSDFNALASNFGSTDAFWSDGDFNYDGNVNLQDFNRLAAYFGLSAAGPDVTPQDWARLGAAVPEPAALGFTGVAASAAMLIRRRRRAS